jgi:hypothetical protein
MAHTASRVTPGGFTYRMGGAEKKTITDVTWSGATASETVTAAELGLSVIFSATATIQASVASATGVVAACTVSAAGDTVTVALNTASGAGTGQAGSIARVIALGN